MSQLTKEQIEAAMKVFNSTSGYNMQTSLIAAAPYLQLPWELIGQEEQNRCWSNFLTRECSGSLDRDSLLFAVINDFISRRNAALLPKVDERVEVVKQILIGQWAAASPGSCEDISKHILAALDKVRS